MQETDQDSSLKEAANGYKIFLDFVDAYLPAGFDGIGESDPLMVQVSELLDKNNQFMYLADMLKLQVLYVSPNVKNLMGIHAEQFDPGILFRWTHPEDIARHSISRARMIQLCNDTYINDEGVCCIMSTNMRYRHSDGHYFNCLVQGYVFCAKSPIHTTYALFLNTDIDWFGPIRHGFNHYIGRDMSLFRYPDREVILKGSIFTDREYEILTLLRNGLDSQRIGEKLFISPHTVDTHRRNILKKTGHHSTAELIIDLQERGFF